MLAIAAIERVDTLHFEEIRRSIDLTGRHIGVTGFYDDSPSNAFSLAPATLRMLEIRDGTWRLAQ